jgi:hypothetical protein
MPDINNAVALGVQVPPPQKTSDIIAPISSLANLQYMQANADKVKAETGQIGQTTQFTQGKLQALSDYNERVKGGDAPEVALQKSGLAAYDPAGATAMLGNIKGGMELGAVRNYRPGDPTSLAAGGPAMVGQELTNQKTATDTRKTGTEISDKQLQLYGQVGNVMASDPSPKGREEAATLARKAGVDEKTIQQFINLPDQQYVLAGQHFQQASMTPERYMDVTGQKDYNQGIAKVATSQEKVGAGETMSRGPAAYAVTHGQPIPGNPALGAPPSGQVGSPSLGNFAPAAAQPQAGVPTLAGPGGAPVQPGLTPSAPTNPGTAPATIDRLSRQGATDIATPAQMADSRGVGVRNVNAVSVPSVGVNVPPEIAEVAKKYEGQRPGLAAYLGRTSQMESGGNPNAYNAQSKAAGPFQFVPSTGAAYLNGKSPFDLAGSADAAARLAIDNDKSLTKSLGQSPTDAQLYLAHQQGAGGAAKLLLNPNARAGDLVGNSAIAANGGNPNAPASAFTNLWATKFNGGVGKTIPSAAVSPNITPVAPGGAGPNISGGIAPLAAALTPTPSAAPTPAPAAPPLQAAPVPVANAAPAVAPLQPVNSAAPPATGLAADNTKSLLPAGYQPVDAGPSKAILAEQEQQGAAYGKTPEELDKAASAAKTTNTTLDNMASASDSWRMGKWADKEQGVREGLQAVAKSLGVNTPSLDNKIADYQDFVKQSGQILRQASHDTSSRVGVQEMQLISKSLPNPELTEGGFKQVATQMKGLNDFAIAKQQAAADWKAANGGSLGPNKSGKDFQAAWNASASPAAFILHRMQQENPAGLQNLIGTMSKTPEGKAALQNLKSQMTWANDQGLFGK